MSLEIKTGYMTAAQLEELEKNKGSLTVPTTNTTTVSSDAPKINIETAASKVGADIKVTTPKPIVKEFGNDVQSILNANREPTNMTTAYEGNSGVNQVLDAYRANKTRFLQETINLATMGDADQAAQIQILSKEFGIAPSIVETNLAELKRKSELMKIDFKTLQADSPILAEQLQNITFSSVAHDDLEPLGAIESAFKIIKDGAVDAFTGAKNVPTGFKAGNATADYGQIGFSILNNGGNYAESDLAEIKRLQEIMAEKPKDSWLGDAGYVAGSFYEPLRDAGIVSTGTALTVAGGTYLATLPYQGPLALTPDPSDLVTGGGAAITGMAAAAPAFVTSLANSAFQIEAGHSYLDLREMGATHENASNIAFVVGTTNAALEMIGVKAITAPWRKTWNAFIQKKVNQAMTRKGLVGNVLGTYLAGIGVETGTEVLQEITAIMGEEFAKMQDEGIDVESLLVSEEGHEEIWNRLEEIFKTTARGMTILALPGAASQYYSGSAQVSQAEQTTQLFEALSTGAVDSKLVKRLPEEAQAFIKEVTKDGDVDTVYIDHEKFNDYLNKRGIDPKSEEAKTFFQDLGIDEQLDELAVTGGDVAIPIEKYTTNIANTDHHPDLAPHIRVNQDHWSASESENWVKNNPDYTANLIAIEEEAERIRNLTNTERENNIVYKEVFDQLVSQGTSREDSTAQAAMYSAVFEVLGKEGNIDSAELFKKYGLDIQRVFDGQNKVQPKKEIIDVVEEVLADKIVQKEAAAYETSEKITAKKQIEVGTKLNWDGKNWEVESILKGKDDNATKIGLRRQFGSKGRQSDELWTNMVALKSEGLIGWNKDFIVEESYIPDPNEIIPASRLATLKKSVLEDIVASRDIQVEDKATKAQMIDRIVAAQTGAKQAPIAPVKPKVSNIGAVTRYIRNKGGISMESDLADDLRSQDVSIYNIWSSPATTPAEEAAQAYDNIPVQEFIAATGVVPDEDNGYVSVDWLFERIVAEDAGTASLNNEEQAAMDAYENDLAAYEEELATFEKTTEDVNTELEDAQRADVESMQYDMAEMTDFLENTLGIDLEGSTPEDITALIQEQLYDPDGRILDQAAFHGTGLDKVFKQFSTDFIGTGEGAQVFGWGLYFASQEAVARHYAEDYSGNDLQITFADGTQETITKDNRSYDLISQLNAVTDRSKIGQDKRFEAQTTDKKLQQINLLLNDEEFLNTGSLDSINQIIKNKFPSSVGDNNVFRWRRYSYGTNLEMNISPSVIDDGEFWSRIARGRPKSLTKENKRQGVLNSIINEKEIYEITLENYNDDIQIFAKYRDTEIKEIIKKGTLYEVDLKPAEDEYLVWDYRLADQPDKVKKILRQLEKEHNLGRSGGYVQGRDVIKHMGYDANLTGTKRHAIPKRTSQELLRRGIRGIKFADGNTRYTDNPDWNYVIFDDKDVEITRVFNQETIEPSEPELTLEEFIDAKQYQGTHRAPTSSYGAPGHDLTDGMYPDDVYGPNGNRYYGDGSAAGEQAMAHMHAMRGKPDYEITVYRAAPKDAKTINPGDWVTTVKSYADEHGFRQYDEGEYTVLSKKVKAKEIYTEGNSLFEWGYSPTERQSEFFQTVPIMDGREKLRKYGLDERKRNRNQDVALALQSRQRKKYGFIDFNDISKEAENKVAGWIAAEVRYKARQVDDQNSAVGWYSIKFQKGLDTLGKRYPELISESGFKNSKLPGVRALENQQNARDFFTLLVAMTSDGQKVKQNFALAAGIYDKFRKTGKVPETGTFGGERIASMLRNAKRINQMVEEKGFKGTRDFLLQVKTVGELNKIAAQEKLKFDSGFLVDTTLPMASVVIGDKLGTFYANLMGFDGYVTMDRWFSRTINRYRGDLLKKATPSSLKTFRALLNQPNLTDEETILASVEHERAYRKSGYKDKTRINQVANTVFKNSFGGLNDVPRNKSDRRFMQNVVTNARKRLKKSGIELTEADIQAILWYYEKQLYGELGAVASQEISYEEAADILVNNKKVAPGVNVEGPGGQMTEIYDQDRGLKRGSIQFRNVGRRDQKTIISLFEAADNSTFIHESGHFFLQVMQDVAESAEASDAIKADWQSTLDYLGVKSGEDIGVREHEKWAESFEKYLYEGKAPTIEMEGPFRKFKAWLQSVYKQATGLEIEINDDIRGVFDRLFGTKDEIRLAQQQFEILALFESPEVMGFDDKKWQEYQTAVQQATQEQEDDLDQKKLKEVTRQNSKAYQIEIKAMEEEVTQEAEAMPVYKAIHYLQNGEDITSKEPLEGFPALKMNTKALKETFGPGILNKIPHRRKMHSSTGTHHEDIAAIFGFESGLDMITQMQSAQPIKQFIKSQAAERVARDSGALSMNPQKLTEEAVKSIAGSKARGRLLKLQMDMTARKAKIPGTPINVLKESARILIANKKVSAIHVKKARAAEVRAYKAAQKAITEENWFEANKQVVTQTLNYFIHREAEAALDRVEKDLVYLDRISKPKYAKKLDRDAIDAIYALLNKVDLRKTRGTFKQTVAKHVENLKAEGIELPTGEQIKALMEAEKTHWKDMTFAEFETFVDSVKSIESVAKYKQKILDQNEKLEFTELVEDLVLTAKTENPQKIVKETGDWKLLDPNFVPTKFKGFLKMKGEFLAAHDKMEFIFQTMDGEKLNGVWWNTFFNRLADAESLETQMNEKFITEMTKIFQAKHTRSEKRNWQKIVQTKKGKFSKENIIALALNWGNVQNREALLEGFRETKSQWGITDKDIEDMLNQHMEAKDWELVQQVWDLINELWPDIAALQKRVTGLVPPKVEAAAFETKFGTMKGGYYPLSYDREFNFIKDLTYESSQSNNLYDRPSFARAATKQGHVEARTDQKGRLVRMDLNVISEHLNNVIHDITHREAIFYMNRLINNQSIRGAIAGVVGNEVLGKIEPWIRRVANPRPAPYSSLEQVLNYANTSATVVAMGFKVTTALVQFFGYSQSKDLLGYGWAWQGLSSFYSNPIQNKEAIFARSPMMRTRTKTLDRDVREAVSNITAKDSRLKEVKSKYFYFIGMMDMYVSLPTWQGAYEKAIHEGMSEKEAIALGDSAVRMTQSSGAIKDLADIQGREDTLFKLFTKFYSYFSAYWNMSRRNTRLRKRGDRTMLESFDSFFWLTILPAVAAEALLGRGPNRDDDDDNDNLTGWSSWSLIQAATFRFSGMVGIRDFKDALLNPQFGMGSPWQDMFEYGTKIPNAMFDIMTGEDDANDWKALLLGISYITQLPGRQMSNMYEHLVEVFEEGEEFNLYEFMVSVNRND